MRPSHALAVALVGIAASTSALAVESALRAERFHDELGRITRERAFDVGVLVRDDEVFEDGSRKAYGR